MATKLTTYRAVATPEAMAKLRVLVPPEVMLYLARVAACTPVSVERYVGRIAAEGGLDRYLETQPITEEIL